MNEPLRALLERTWTIDGDQLPAPRGQAPQLLVLRFFESITQVQRDAWNRCSGDCPFLSYAYLRALEEGGMVGGESGHVPCYIVLFSADGMIVAAAPAVLRTDTRADFGPEV